MSLPFSNFPVQISWGDIIIAINPSLRLPCSQERTICIYSVKNEGSGAIFPGFKSWLYYLLNLWPWASHFSNPLLFFICNSTYLGSLTISVCLGLWRILRHRTLVKSRNSQVNGDKLVTSIPTSQDWNEDKGHCVCEVLGTAACSKYHIEFSYHP